MLFRSGWNAVQVQRWLGHKPSFTLDTYVHLLDADVSAPEFFDALARRGGQQMGNARAETGRNHELSPDAESASFAAEKLATVRSL